MVRFKTGHTCSEYYGTPASHYSWDFVDRSKPVTHAGLDLVRIYGLDINRTGFEPSIYLCILR